MRVYIVVSGEYSDKRIEAVYENLENAEKFAAAHYDGNIVWGRDYNILAFETSDGAIRADNKVVYVYRFFKESIYKNDSPKIMFENDFKRIECDPKDRYVVLYERNDDRAYKILLDEIAKEKAEEEGL